MAGELVALQSTTQGLLRHPSQLNRIRVTSLKTFEKCPFTWAMKYLPDGPPEEEVKSKYAAIGTAVHSICEDTLMQLWAGRTEQESDAADLGQAWAIIPPTEADKTHEYLASLMEIPVKVPLVIEERLNYVIIEGMPPISGQIDYAVELDVDAYNKTVSEAKLLKGTALLIGDHKTNRSYNGPDWWAGQLQQLIYTYMARREWPGYDHYMFRIGYPNLGMHVEWLTNPEDEEPLVERISGIWKKMLEYANTQWPLMINDECGYCPFKTVCPEYENAHMDFAKSFTDKVGQSDAVIKLEYIKNVKKIIEALEGEMEEIVSAEIKGAGGKLISGGNIYTLETGNTRKANFKDTLTAFDKYIALNPDSGPVIQSMFEELFTVKVGGFDKLGKKFPAIKPVLESLYVKTPSAITSIKSVPLTKEITK